MGLVKGGERQSKIFLRMDGKKGAFVESVKNEGAGSYDQVVAPPNTTLTGFLTSFKVVQFDNKEGKRKFNIVLGLDDTDPAGKPMVVEATLWRQEQDSNDQTKGSTTGFGLRLLAALNACDPRQPMTLMPWHMAKGDAMADGSTRTSDGTGVSIRQNGTKVVPVYLIDGKPVDKLPPLPSQVFAGKTFYDKESWATAADELCRAITAKMGALPEQEAAYPEEEDGINPQEAALAANQSQERQRA